MFLGHGQKIPILEEGQRFLMIRADANESYASA